MSKVDISNLGFGGSGIPDVLPKAIAELQNLTLSVVVGAGADTPMLVPGLDPEDTIGSVVDLSTPASIDLDTLTIVSRNAMGEIQALTTAADGDTVEVNGKTYTIADVVVHTSYNAPPFVVPIDITPSGNDAEELADRLAKAIMSGDSTLTASVEEDDASPPALTKVVVRVREAGTDGNAVTLSTIGTAVTVSGATFSGGADAADAGFSSSVSLSGKNLLVLWYDKDPTAVTAAPLAMAASAEAASADLQVRRFRGGVEVAPETDKLSRPKKSR